MKNNKKASFQFKLSDRKNGGNFSFIVCYNH